MSPSSSVFVRLRAFVAAALLCGMTFNPLVVVAAIATQSQDHAVHFSKTIASASHCAEHSSDSGLHKGGNPHRSHDTGCPLCCLAAGAAVLPSRVGAPIRLERVVVTRVAYSARSGREPESLVTPSVNGARAPPRV